MDALTERFEVQLPGHTLQLLRSEAERRGVPVAELIREAIDLLLAQDRQVRVHAAEALFQVEAPVRDWPEMKREIEDARLQAGSL
jgi:hypothetical protein